MMFRSVLTLLLTLISIVPNGEAQFIQRWDRRPHQYREQMTMCRGVETAHMQEELKD
jgi:hypothetical protein